jgi:hypothetical protein
MPKLLVLGDDLTGSNATGALYARFGLRAVSVNAPLEPDAPYFRAESGIDALVINLGTRHTPPSHAGRAVRRAIALAGPVEPGVAARIPPALGETARLVLGTHRIDGRDAAAAFRGSGWRSPRPEAKPRLSQSPAWNT